MSLAIRKSSKWRYGVIVVNRRKTIVNLGNPITGKRPPKRTMPGDDGFERSRGPGDGSAWQALRQELRCRDRGLNG